MTGIDTAMTMPSPVPPVSAAPVHRADSISTSLRGRSALLLASWPVAVMLAQLIAGGHATAGWFVGWLGLVVCCAVGSMLLARARGFDLARLDLPAVFTMAYPLFVMSGVPGMCAEFAGTSGAQRLVLGTVVAYLGTIVGMVAALHLGSRWSAPAETPTSMVQRLVALCAVLVGVLLLGYYIAATGVPPIVRAAQGVRGEALSQARQDAVVELTNPIARYAFNFVRLYLLPVVSAALIVTWARRRTWGAALAALAVTSLAFVTAALTLEKSPVVRLTLIVLLALVVGGGLRLRLRWIAMAGGIALAFPLLVLAVGNPESTMFDVVKLFGDRIFIDPARVLYHYFQWAPDESGGFLGGRLVPFVGPSVGPEVKVTQIISNRIFPNATVQGNANAAFVGNLWVDFGWWGVTLGSLFTGIVVGVLQRLLATIKRQPLGAAVTGLVCLQVVFLVQTSLFDAVLSIGFGLMDVVVIALVWTRVFSIADSPDRS